jgi:molybdopterin molybdotransferase
VKQNDIGFDHAYDLAMNSSQSIGTKTVALTDGTGKICSENILARVDSPSVNSSLKDGYAVVSVDLKSASKSSPVSLEIKGHIAAGIEDDIKVSSGCTVRIMSGASIPDGADAVLAEEFTSNAGKHVNALAGAEKGRNIMLKGSDVSAGEILAEKGQMLTPPLTGLLAAGGISEITVCRWPKIGLLATGSEVLLPGKKLEKGKLYASNVVLQNSHLKSIGFQTQIKAAGDSVEEIELAVKTMLENSDVLITSGGTWKGDRDLVVKVLENLGCRMLFHRVMMRPGKAVGMGILDDKPVFCLPGGPTSNEMTFLMIAFPAIMKVAGYRYSPHLQLYGKLKTEIKGQKDWTQFKQCRLEWNEKEISLQPMKMKRRLASMAKTQAIVKIPEGVEVIPAETNVPFFICTSSNVIRNL